MFRSSAVFFHCLSRQRFVNKRSIDLDSSSIDDARAERAAIAVYVGLSWPPVKRRRSAGRPSWQQNWERALQEHFLHHREIPHGVRLQWPGWWQPRDAIARQLTHEEIASVSTPAAPVAPATALIKDKPRQRYKAPQHPRRPHRARLDEPVEDGTARLHAAVLG